MIKKYKYDRDYYNTVDEFICEYTCDDNYDLIENRSTEGVGIKNIILDKMLNLLVKINLHIKYAFNNEGKI